MEDTLLGVMPVVFAHLSVKVWCTAVAPNVWLWVVKSEGCFFAHRLYQKISNKSLELLLLTDRSMGPKACFI